jgi:AraC family transcriptional regulator of arabinose operon
MDQRITKVVELMRDNLCHGLSLEALAQAVNLSPSRLHNVFKSETGMSPARYLKTLRLEQAKELLEESFLSVKEIRVRAGIGDESHFVRDFRKAYGLTPTQYRARHQALSPGAKDEASREQPVPEEDSHGARDVGGDRDAPQETAAADDEGADLMALALPAYG